MNIENNDFYWFCREIYATVCDFVEEENNIKITSTKNAEKFVEWMRNKVLIKPMIGYVEKNK